MSQQQPFDVFMSHNSKDKPMVRQLNAALKARGLKVWFDEEELRPGIPWQRLLEEGIKSSGSVAVLVGADGLGPWEDEEMQGALRLAVRDGRAIIPVLLSDAPDHPELPLFLGNRTWVDLRGGLTKENLDLLQWGITGVKPNHGSSQSAAPSVVSQTSPAPTQPSNPVLEKWQKKLQFLQMAEAIAASPALRFELMEQIEEAKAKIVEFGG
ncbi:MAG TPA: toll/interleukin-1 receptor domain-containing protein [Abditibacteriaceae bacterium]|jgi:hypothetical protein